MSRVLIVEDAEVIAQGMARHLGAAGFDPVWVGNGDQGLARLRYEQPDVCVLDLMLPRLGGWKLLETVRGARTIKLMGAAQSRRVRWLDHLVGQINGGLRLHKLGLVLLTSSALLLGVDGVLTADLPPEEAEPFLAALRPHGLDPIFLLAPTTAEGRIGTICKVASGFVYYVSVKGVTGAATLDVEAVRSQVARLRSHTGLPVGVGFGIKDGPSAAAVAQVADAVIVGSALVRRIEELRDDPDTLLAQISGFVDELRRAIDGAC